MKHRRPPSLSYRRRPVSMADVGPGLRRDDTTVSTQTPSIGRLTLEELVARMTPENEHPLEDDGPRGEEMI
jgi:hypothetical protein